MPVSIEKCPLFKAAAELWTDTPQLRKEAETACESLAAALWWAQVYCPRGQAKKAPKP